MTFRCREGRIMSDDSYDAEENYFLPGPLDMINFHASTCHHQKTLKYDPFSHTYLFISRLTKWLHRGCMLSFHRHVCPCATPCTHIYPQRKKITRGGVLKCVSGPNEQNDPWFALTLQFQLGMKTKWQAALHGIYCSSLKMTLWSFYMFLFTPSVYIFYQKKYDLYEHSDKFQSHATHRCSIAQPSSLIPHHTHHSPQRTT